MTVEFLITSLIVVASPGTGALYTIAAGLSAGRRASAFAAFTCTLGIIPHLASAMLGLAALLHTSAVAFNTVKYAGIVYLLYMAWQSLREHGVLRIEANPVAKSGLRILRDGILLNVLNPKLSIFFVAFLPQFVKADDTQPLIAMLNLSLAFMAMTFVVFLLYGWFAAVMRERVVERPALLKWLRYSFAAAFAGLGAKLALQQR